MFKKNQRRIEFEQVKSKGWLTRVRRAKVPGGWLVVVENTFGLSSSFIHDPTYAWELDSE